MTGPGLRETERKTAHQEHQLEHVRFISITMNLNKMTHYDLFKWTLRNRMGLRITISSGLAVSLHFPWLCPLLCNDHILTLLPSWRTTLAVVPGFTPTHLNVWGRKKKCYCHRVLSKRVEIHHDCSHPWTNDGGWGNGMSWCPQVEAERSQFSSQFPKWIRTEAWKKFWCHKKEKNDSG